MMPKLFSDASWLERLKMFTDLHLVLDHYQHRFSEWGLLFFSSFVRPLLQQPTNHLQVKVGPWPRRFKTWQGNWTFTMPILRKWPWMMMSGWNGDDSVAQWTQWTTGWHLLTLLLWLLNPDKMETRQGNTVITTRHVSLIAQFLKTVTKKKNERERDHFFLAP